jgi:hypothetical protein
MTEEE